MTRSDKSLLQHYASRVVTLEHLTTTQATLIAAQKSLILSLKRAAAQSRRASQHRD